MGRNFSEKLCELWE